MCCVILPMPEMFQVYYQRKAMKHVGLWKLQMQCCDVLIWQVQAYLEVKPIAQMWTTCSTYFHKSICESLLRHGRFVVQFLSFFCFVLELTFLLVLNVLGILLLKWEYSYCSFDVHCLFCFNIGGSHILCRSCTRSYIILFDYFVEPVNVDLD